jgi:hypothetical protein
MLDGFHGNHKLSACFRKWDGLSVEVRFNELRFLRETGVAYNVDTDITVTKMFHERKQMAGAAADVNESTAAAMPSPELSGDHRVDSVVASPPAKDRALSGAP